MALTGCFKAKEKDSRKTRQETTEGLNDKIKHRVRRGEKNLSTGLVRTSWVRCLLLMPSASVPRNFHYSVTR